MPKETTYLIVSRRGTYWVRARLRRGPKKLIKALLSQHPGWLKVGKKKIRRHGPDYLLVLFTYRVRSVAEPKRPRPDTPDIEPPTQ